MQKTLIVFNHPIARLRVIGLTEGVSFLLLLLVAMPLKYLAGFPMAVKVVGWAHGLLFMLYCWALFDARNYANWGIRRSLLLFVAALVPFGPLLADRGLKREQAQPEQASAE